jgi:hypothetical protein
MILYHFTDLCCLKNGGTILTEGLKPKSAAEQMANCVPPFGVVWLTTWTALAIEETNLVPTDARGVAEPIWAERMPEVRIQLAIPSSDRKLVNWEAWLRKHRPDILGAVLCFPDPEFDIRPRLKNYFVYFGTVPLKYFRAIERTALADGEEMPAQAVSP